MSKKLGYREIKKIAGQLGWSVSKAGKDIELAQCSPAGEDFRFNISGNDYVKDITDYAYNFDIDEHIELWASLSAKEKARMGVPCTRVLVDDARAIKSMLDKLVKEVRAYYEKENI